MRPYRYVSKWALEQHWLIATHPCIVEFGLDSHVYTFLLVLRAKHRKFIRRYRTMHQGSKSAFGLDWFWARRHTRQHLLHLKVRTSCQLLALPEISLRMIEARLAYMAIG